MGMNWETSIVPVPEPLRLADAPAPLEAAKSHRPDLPPILVSPPKKTNSSRRNPGSGSGSKATAEKTSES